MSQLRNPNASRFDYAEGWGTGGCTDIDVVFERYGHFLMIENKRPGQKISRGQQIAFQNLSNPRSLTFLHVIGHPPDNICGFGPLGGAVVPATTEDLRRYVEDWFEEKRRVSGLSR